MKIVHLKIASLENNLVMFYLEQDLTSVTDKKIDFVWKTDRQTNDAVNTRWLPFHNFFVATAVVYHVLELHSVHPSWPGVWVTLFDSKAECLNVSNVSILDGISISAAGSRAGVRQQEQLIFWMIQSTVRCETRYTDSAPPASAPFPVPYNSFPRGLLSMSVRLKGGKYESVKVEFCFRDDGE